MYYSFRRSRSIQTQRWDRKLENFTTAKDVKDSNQKKAMLLHYAEEEVLGLSDSLGIVADTMYDETKRMLT